MINNPISQIDFHGVFPKIEECVNREINTIANTPIVILPVNIDRKYAAFVNNCDIDITLVLGTADKSSLNKGIILKAYGGSFEISVINWYIGKVSAISAKAAKISVVECS